MTAAMSAWELAGWILWSLVVVVATVFDGMFCGMETGIYVMNKIRLDLRAEAGSRPARVLRGMIRQPNNLLAVLLIGTNLGRFVSTFAITSMFVMAGHAARAEWYTLAVATPLMFVVSDSVPKGVFQRRGEALVYRFGWLLRGADLLFKATGLSYLVRAVAGGIMRLLRARPIASDEHHPGAILAESFAAGVMTHPQSVMADRVMRIGTLTLADVCRPLSGAVTATLDAAREPLRECVQRHNYSRLPVIDETGQVAGILDVYDILASEGELDVRAVMTPPLVLSGTLDVAAALYRMQRGRSAMAVVAQESGRHVGIVTIKDLVQQIVGEIGEW